MSEPHHLRDSAGLEAPKVPFYGWMFRVLVAAAVQLVLHQAHKVPWLANDFHHQRHPNFSPYAAVPQKSQPIQAIDVPPFKVQFGLQEPTTLSARERLANGLGAEIGPSLSGLLKYESLSWMIRSVTMSLVSLWQGYNAARVGQLMSLVSLDAWCEDLWASIPGRLRLAGHFLQE